MSQSKTQFTRPDAPISPLIAAGSRFPVGTGNPEQDSTQLSDMDARSFLMRGAESVQHSRSGFAATPKSTTGYDGTVNDESEDFTQPDFSP